jgi:aminoglycoside phosphotransferase (APT) family kinase protein
MGPATAPRGTIEVRAGHRFDVAAFERYLRERLAGFVGPVKVRQFEGGQSNPTFHLAAASGAYVLRKKPPGRLLPSAHAIDREFRVLETLAGSAVPVARPRLYCGDAAIIGTAFYVMDYVPGRIFADPLLPGMSAAERRAIYDAMNGTLAVLHLFDWRAAELEDFGRTENYVARQIARWSKQYAETKTKDVPAMDRLQRWLEERIPPGEVTALVHGDFRLGNLIFHDSEPRVVAVLDWELATLGHPFADLAYNCMAYHWPAGHAVAPGFEGIDIGSLGIPAEDAYVAAYARRTGRDAVPDFTFFLAFSLFRVAAIQQGVYARSLQGNASSATAARFGAAFEMVAERAWNLVAAR